MTNRFRDDAVAICKNDVRPIYRAASACIAIHRIPPKGDSLGARPFDMVSSLRVRPRQPERLRSIGLARARVSCPFDCAQLRTRWSVLRRAAKPSSYVEWPVPFKERASKEVRSVAVQRCLFRPVQTHGHEGGAFGRGQLREAPLAHDLGNGATLRGKRVRLAQPVDDFFRNEGVSWACFSRA